MADKNEVHALKTDLIKSFWAAAKNKQEPPSTAVVAYIYANTTRGSTIRLLLTDWWNWKAEYLWFPMSDTHDWLFDTAEFAVDLVLGIKRKAQESDAFANGKPEKYFEG